MAQGATTKVKKRKKSVIKRAKQSRVRAEANRANTTRVRTIMKKLRSAIAAKDSASAGSLLRPTLAAIERAISKGVLEENTGNRYKSRLSIAVNGLSAAAKA
jgi:small subunit ribosomal protein S20